ncbi:hypothetical protein ACFWCA_45575 [Streptomyces phaeochromogenes]|uniref:hypothetical protein n=1 Tax=Streptomyces phaeochromogenes TaxID=1923 RepID=UPI003675D7AB
MRALRKVSMVAGIAAIVTLSLAPQAQASQNSGWVYTSNLSGAVYFDADLNGYPGVEKITVCDNKTDGRGVTGEVVGQDGSGTVRYIITDPSNDGHCESMQGNYFLEDTPVNVFVSESWGSNSAHPGAGTGVA